jgi:asparagine synthase (glutamine-hydrolysing)
MMGRLAHRGPDAEGLRVEDSGTLGHVRLSIIDPERGNQPIEDENRNRAIVANGEVYNAPSLRRRLDPAHRFRTRSDNESALHLYEDMGPRAMHFLDGMYALAIADGDDLFLARDPIGIKPLYHGSRNGDLVFASELKALVGVADDVQEFPPGSYYHSELGFRPYYVVPDRSPRPMPLETQLRLLRATLERSVVKRLMSDVPIGAFLSGGFDSSVIAALVRPHVDELHTFSVGFEDSPDLEAARRVASYLDTIHHEYFLDREEVRSKLAEVIYFLESFDQDLVRSAVPCYFVARLASQHVKVVLTGEGADELFAGYRYYKDLVDDETLRAELRRSVAALHNVNLQRVDRLTMAHSLEARVPFLDLEMVEMAQTVPVHLKVRDLGNGKLVEKWILRAAFEDRLPAEIVWRDKAQFDEGTGATDCLSAIASDWMNLDQAQRYAARFASDKLRSPEECLYHHLLRGSYSDPSIVLANVARWADRPEQFQA